MQNDLLKQACDRIFDMLQKPEDGQAWSEAERFLKQHAPDLYNKLGINPDTTKELGL